MENELWEKVKAAWEAVEDADATLMAARASAKNPPSNEQHNKYIDDVITAVKKYNTAAKQYQDMFGPVAAPYEPLSGDGASTGVGADSDADTGRRGAGGGGLGGGDPRFHKPGSGATANTEKGLTEMNKRTQQAADLTATVAPMAVMMEKINSNMKQLRAELDTCKRELNTYRGDGGVDGGGGDD